MINMMQSGEEATSWYCKSKHPPWKDKAAIFHCPLLTSFLLSDVPLYIFDKASFDINFDTYACAALQLPQRKVSPIFAYAIFFPGAVNASQSLLWPLLHHKSTLPAGGRDSSVYHLSLQRTFTYLPLLSVSCFKLTVIFRAEATPPCLRTQSFYLTQVKREAGWANLSAPNRSPVSRYGLFTRLSLHTNELFNNSVGQRNKLSSESCGNSSGTDEDLTSGAACLSSQVLLSWDQLRAPVFTLQRDHLQVGTKICFPSACLLQNTES